MIAMTIPLDENTAETIGRLEAASRGVDYDAVIARTPRGKFTTFAQEHDLPGLTPSKYADAWCDLMYTLWKGEDTDRGAPLDFRPELRKAFTELVVPFRMEDVGIPRHTFIWACMTVVWRARTT